MFVEFKVENFLSFKNLKTLSLVASSLKDHVESNVFTVQLPQARRVRGLNLLKSAVIYGANASGKSNLVKAISFMRSFVLESSRSMQAHEQIPVTGFLFSTEKENEPSLFEIVFIHENIRYRYGFEVDRQKVHNEWLFSSPKGKEAQLFIREGSKISIGKYFREGRGLENKTRSNALFLSVAAQFNGEISSEIINWFQEKLRVISGLRDQGALDFSFDRIRTDKFREEAVSFMKIADLGIVGIMRQQVEINEAEVSDSLKEAIMAQVNLALKAQGIGETKDVKGYLRRVLTLHQKYDRENKKVDHVPLDLFLESEGTQKLFSWSAPLLDTLQRGNVLVADELEARFHPMMTQFLIHLFNSYKTNPQNAQLIFAAHDSNLLDRNFFRRDQIWFTEKDRYGVTDLYPLIDYRVRKDATFKKDYFLGKYGAIPIIGDPQLLFGDLDEEA